MGRNEIRTAARHCGRDYHGQDAERPAQRRRRGPVDPPGSGRRRRRACERTQRIRAAPVAPGDARWQILGQHSAGRYRHHRPSDCVYRRKQTCQRPWPLRSERSFNRQFQLQRLSGGAPRRRYCYKASVHFVVHRNRAYGHSVGNYDECTLRRYRQPHKHRCAGCGHERHLGLNQQRLAHPQRRPLGGPSGRRGQGGCGYSHRQYRRPQHHRGHHYIPCAQTARPDSLHSIQGCRWQHRPLQRRQRLSESLAYGSRRP